ncbi:hypothetical protein [Nannocystis pusilla]|uniref:hypothetical protein n=1 Tax=Nannocystis pusilla TaxID=889268 RepID=UPI003B767E7A
MGPRDGRRDPARLSQLQGCTGGECSSAEVVPSGGSTDVLAGIGRLGKWIIGGTAALGVAVGVVLVVRARAD